MASEFYFSAMKDREVILLVSDDDPVTKAAKPTATERVTAIVELCIKNVWWLENGVSPSNEEYDAFVTSCGSAGIISLKGGTMNIG